MTTKHIEFKNASGTHIAEVLANKGIYFQVRDDAGEEYAVPKKQVIRGPWEEPTIEEEVAELTQARGPSLAAALAQVQATDKAKAQPKAKKDPAPTAERDPNLVTLKELCFELNVVPRIARRKLRKALGQVGTGSRWEWTKGSEELATVTKALSAPSVQEEADAEEDMGDATP